MHDSLTPIGGLGPMVLMMLNVVFGGEGVGLMNLLIFVLLTVFICSLVVGKTPEYLNMPIGAREMYCLSLSHTPNFNFSIFSTCFYDSWSK